LALNLLIIPLLWAIVGTAAAFRFGVTEDFGLTGHGGRGSLFYPSSFN
jgi:hypothetical protein